MLIGFGLVEFGQDGETLVKVYGCKAVAASTYKETESPCFWGRGGMGMFPGVQSCSNSVETFASVTLEQDLCWMEMSHGDSMATTSVPTFSLVMRLRTAPLDIDEVYCSLSAAASTAAETGGHFPAAAFPGQRARFKFFPLLPRKRRKSLRSS